MNYKFGALSLVICLVLRVFTLDIPNLVDPTETRYAIIAQEMVMSGDWIVPKLPQGNETQVYLGKPPLHFWLTAVTFGFFGVDEWTARLPSFLALLCMCVGTFAFVRYAEFRKAAWSASVILASCGICFFRSGNSIVDVTFAAAMTAAFAALYRCVVATKISVAAVVVLSASLGFAFLAKGPVAIPLLLLVVVPWYLIRWETPRCNWIHPAIGAAVFIGVASPWFWLVQLRQPDFLAYFFVNENLARFFLDDYGDRYGVGHRHIYGTIWGMFLLGFTPWSLPLCVELWKQRVRLLSIRFWRDHPAHLFSFLWAISPLVVFTFARQLHAAYLLPGMPGAALFTALVLRDALESRVRITLACAGVAVIAGIAVMVGVAVQLNHTPVLGVIEVVTVATLVVTGYRIYSNGWSCNSLAVVATVAYCWTTVSLSDEVSARRSSKRILECLARESAEPVPIIGTVNATSYGLHLYARTPLFPIEKTIRVVFVRGDAEAGSFPDNVLVRWIDKTALTRMPELGFEMVRKVGRWNWFRRIGGGTAKVISSCPECGEHKVLSP